MSIINLDKIFHPKTIAVIGASERKGSVGDALMHNLVERGFSGEIYPIHPHQKKIWGKSVYSKIGELKAPVDMAILATPIGSAPQLVKECAAAGVGGAVIISAGGKEIGEEGRKIEKVWGTVLSENTQMLALGKKTGFTIQKVRGVNEYELSLDLQKA